MFAFSEWQQEIVQQINKANFSGDNEDWSRVGEYVGDIASRLLEFNVPNVDFVYGSAILVDLQEREAAYSERDGEPDSSDL